MKQHLTIVTICLNDLQGLQETMDSVLNQKKLDFRSVQHLILDGGSVDGSVDYIRSLAAQHAHIAFISESDKGVYDAMNKGLFAADGKYVQFLNSGDRFISETALANFFAISENQPSAKPRMYAFAAVLEKDGKQSPIRSVPHNWVAHAFGVKPHCHQAMFFDTVTSKAMGGYSLDCSFAADFEYIVKLGLVCEVISLKEPLISYKSGGISHNRKSEIPLLLHEIRCRIFQLGRITSKIDLSFVRLLQAYRFLRVVLQRKDWT
jgi:glycosyltransferase involved in cell wall biosynthesis